MNSDRPVNVELLARIVRAGAEQIRQNLPLDGDWSPILQFIDADGGVQQIFATGLTSPIDDVRRQAVLDVAHTLISMRAVALVFIHVAWVVTRDAEGIARIQAGNEPRARDADDRQEELQVIAFDRERVVSWSALITRPDGEPHPQLSPWVGHTDAEYTGGAVFEILREAIQR